MVLQSTESSERLPVGQLLVNLLRLFRAELAARGEGAANVDGVRPAHLQVFGVIKADGSRLTDLANGAGMSLSAMSELVDDLQALGYLQRAPDPADGRAKLVYLTQAGWRAIRSGQTIIEQIEADWSTLIGPDHFNELCLTMQALLDQLDPRARETYTAAPKKPSNNT